LCNRVGQAAEAVVKDIRRQIRKQPSKEEKIRIHIVEWATCLVTQPLERR
jgi:Na+/H+-translocating membrane pyrophosphatase